MAAGRSALVVVAVGRDGGMEVVVMDTMTEIKMPGTPPSWVNSMMSWALRTPGLRSLVGRNFALITVTGAHTGNRYTTPVQYVRDGDRFLVTSQRHRRWWRNIREHPEVELLVRGRTLVRPAHIAEHPESVDRLARLFALDRRLAKFYGIRGEPDQEPCTALAEHIVVIVIG